jgi:thiol:disulfide interchange protein DsbC
MQALKSIDVKSLPLKQAIKHVKGKGERVIYVFSDPDCPYCQHLEKELKNIDNLTVYLFLYPITQFTSKC